MRPAPRTVLGPMVRVHEVPFLLSLFLVAMASNLLGQSSFDLKHEIGPVEKRGTPLHCLDVSQFLINIGKIDVKFPHVTIAFLNKKQYDGLHILGNVKRAVYNLPRSQVLLT